ncbi:MAG TPA: FAD-dependent oxidoreductase [Ensifer sp.]|nr:FAD-dependent oxidoreductase [Ensifer sp.]
MLNIMKPQKPQGNRHVAVIGSGISGLSAAWLMSKHCRVTLIEADSRPGGHSNTVDVMTPNGPVPVDTGFIVYNEWNYPNLVRLFQTIGVKTEVSDMSFSASINNGSFEYSGTSFLSMIGQKTNIVRLRFWQMVGDILRFYREAPVAAKRAEAREMTLGEFLDREGYSKSFVDNHILPMGAAIWSTTAKEMRSYPLVAFIRFFESHGLLSILNRPVWRTVSGGSRQYVQRILADFDGEVRLNSPVRSVRRSAEGVLVDCGQGDELFDDVVIATHGDQALAMRVDASERERALLGAFKYTHNTAVLHSDPGLMPKRKRVWSSWNYIGERNGTGDEQLCVTYWMNMLQNLPTKEPVFVTLNPCRAVKAEKVHATFDYTHPLFDTAALDAQKRLWSIQGQGGIWYCGAHFGSGFHEDGLQSGLAVAESLTGGKRPWQVAGESARIHLPETLAAAE